ncbi:hypothetical protein PM082_007452 [Marasmius tenuissimus]|nr:hypothetical protein PM082_007452 [Marasmius tenuissimus]
MGCKKNAVLARAVCARALRHEKKQLILETQPDECDWDSLINHVYESDDSGSDLGWSMDDNSDSDSLNASESDGLQLVELEGDELDNILEDEPTIATASSSPISCIEQNTFRLNVIFCGYFSDNKDEYESESALEPSDSDEEEWEDPLANMHVAVAPPLKRKRHTIPVCVQCK